MDILIAVFFIVTGVLLNSRSKRDVVIDRRYVDSSVKYVIEVREIR